jgi:hypothetical protein
LKKLGSYLVQTQRTRTHYPHAELFSTTLTRWNGVEELELYSDSDWASCKVTRRSTSSGLNFFNSCCIHGHSRDQASISVSSMEAEILAATGLLVEGIMLKQFLQFSKDLSTRLLWSQQAMRLKWFLVERMSAKENPADLNTKSVVAWRERREYLMRKMALLSDSFESEGAQMSNGKVKQMVRLITWMLVAGNLQGCDVTSSLTRVESYNVDYDDMVDFDIIGVVFHGGLYHVQEQQDVKEVAEAQDILQMGRPGLTCVRASRSTFWPLVS